MTHFAKALGMACALTLAVEARAQYVGPVNPIAPPPIGNYQPPYIPQPTYPTYPPQPVYPTYPPQPVYPTYPPQPFVNPNGVAGGSGSTSMYWDPTRGWVTNTNNTTVLNSATSPGRAPAAGASIQYYNYWNGTQWVRGSRWIGQDGQWHGEDQNTVVGPNGSVTNNTVYRSVNPNAGSAYGTATQPQPQPPLPPPSSSQPRITLPGFRVR